MTVRAIVLCAGEATRWAGYLGTPKHLIVIEGERLLDRLVRLLSERGVDDIHVVVKGFDKRYEVDGASCYLANINYEKNADADKFLSSKELWSQSGRTIVFYGDCYFSEDAIDRILGEHRRDWVLFCRPGRSKITGSQWGECFAQSFYPESLDEHEAALHKVADLYKMKVIGRCGGWEHYRVMAGLPDEKVGLPIMKGRFVEINDWTEDFDFPSDYDGWVKRRKVFNMKRGKARKEVFVVFEVFLDELKLMWLRVKKRQANNIRSFFG
jgi:hypothetical protein